MDKTADAPVCSLCGRPVSGPFFHREGKPPGEIPKGTVICDACQDRLRADATRTQDGR